MLIVRSPAIVRLAMSVIIALQPAFIIMATAALLSAAVMNPNCVAPIRASASVTMTCFTGSVTQIATLLPRPIPRAPSQPAPSATRASSAL